MHIVARAVIGALFGAVIGALVEALRSSPLTDSNGHLPFTGASIGGICGAIFAIAAGNIELSERARRAVIGLIIGATFAMVGTICLGLGVAWFTDEPEFGGKIEAGFRIVGLSCGVSVAAGVGAIGGFFWKGNAERNGDRSRKSD